MKKTKEWSIRNDGVQIDNLSEAAAWNMMLNMDLPYTEILFRNVVMARRVARPASHRDSPRGV